MIALKSAYLSYQPTDGVRYLTETLWPEGVDTFQLSPYLWVRELAPSYDLKETAAWKHWDPERFRAEYKRELQEPRRRAWFELVLAEAGEMSVTLLHHSRKHEDRLRREDTSVFYLKEFFEEELKGSAASAGKSKQAAEQWANEGGK